MGTPLRTNGAVADAVRSIRSGMKLEVAVRQAHRERFWRGEVFRNRPGPCRIPDEVVTDTELESPSAKGSFTLSGHTKPFTVSLSNRDLEPPAA